MSPPPLLSRVNSAQTRYGYNKSNLSPIKKATASLRRARPPAASLPFQAILLSKKVKHYTAVSVVSFVSKCPGK